MPDILPRRRLLAASAAALPALLAIAGCRSSDAFAGPDPLAGRPTPSPDVIALQEVIAAERAMITLYQAAVTSGLRPADSVRATLAQHRQHLAQLQARLVIPPGAPASASASASASAGASPGRVSLARLRAAENASAADLVRRLAVVPPALAQLFASIAASDATHAVALGGLGDGSRLGGSGGFRGSGGAGGAGGFGGFRGFCGGGLAGRAGGRERGHLRVRGGGRPPVRGPQVGR